VIAARRAFEKHLVYWNHMPARAIRTAIGRTFWDRAFKFTIDRHPYEYVVSLVYFLSKSGTPLSRARKLLRTLVRVPTNRQLYSDGNEIIVDRVLRYENLAEELRAIAPQLGVDISGALPKAKAGIRPQGASAGESLSGLERRFIRFRWRREFKLFGYEP
jgi:hypothetical protein